MGITLTNINGKVEVKSVEEGSLAFFKGINERDVITHINDFPLNDHSRAIEVINAAQRIRHPLFITMENDYKEKKPIISLRKMWRVIKKCF